MLAALWHYDIYMAHTWHSWHSFGIHGAFSHATLLRCCTSPARSFFVHTTLVVASMSAGYVNAKFILYQNGQVIASDRRINREHLNTMFLFRSVVHRSHHESGLSKLGDLIVSAPVATVVSLYQYWCMSHLRSIATAHGMRVPAKASQPQLMEALTAHVCDATCLRSQYLFRVLKHPRAGHRSAAAQPRLPEAEVVVASADDNPEGEAAPPAPHVEGIEGVNQVSPSEEDLSYLEIANEQLRQSIMLEWEQTMSTVRLKELVCGVCARRTPPEKILSVKAARIPFELLTNPALPEEVLPQSYDLVAYGGAILHPKGLEHLDKRGPVRICQECRAALFHKDGAKMPLYALANWLYYGHERLPESVKEAFAKSTQVERMLVGRARSSKVSFKFCDMPGHPLYKSDWNLSQGCVKGNVAIHPQDAAQLSEVLPPSYDVLRDTLCAVFVGEKQPTRDTIKKMHPLLVRKSRVKTMIDFLLKHNPKYAVSPT